jgi:hypothetical protein
MSSGGDPVGRERLGGGSEVKLGAARKRDGPRGVIDPHAPPAGCRVQFEPLRRSEAHHDVEVPVVTEAPHRRADRWVDQAIGRLRGLERYLERR